MLSDFHHQHPSISPQLTGHYALYVKRRRLRHWPNLTNQTEKALGVGTVHSQRTWSNSVNLESLQDHFTWKDSMMVMELKLRWLHTVQNIIRHAGSSITTLNCREHKREHSRKKARAPRATRNKLHANAPFTTIEYREECSRNLFLVSSVNNLLRLTVFGKLQHSNWTDGGEWVSE